MLQSALMMIRDEVRTAEGVAAMALDWVGAEERKVNSLQKFKFNENIGEIINLYQSINLPTGCEVATCAETSETYGTAKLEKLT